MEIYSISTSAQGESKEESAFNEVIPVSQSSSKLTKRKPYHVFINHRGCDVKHKLASTIYHTLKMNGFRAFLDEQVLQLGELIGEEIEEAIRSAALHIAIFSVNYAQSPWCLAELSLMVKLEAKIIPVFYNVQPNDLRWVEKGKGIYALAFSEHQEKDRYSAKKLEEWKSALQKVSYMKGYSLNNANDDEGRLLQDIVDYCKQSMEKVADSGPERDQEVEPFSMGMFGGGGGGCWDDEIYSGIHQIVLTVGTVVDSITVQYDLDGLSLWSTRRGGTDSLKIEKVKFDFLNEVLMSISGQYGRKWNCDMITVKCLTFHTNLKKYGPFSNHNLHIDGKSEERIDFATPSTGCKIIGFYGRCGSYLDAIGVHLKLTTQ